MLQQEETVSFVARIWLEHNRNGEPVWRGHIRHVQSGEARHFARLAEMRGFMEWLAGTDFGSFAEPAGCDFEPRG